MRFSRGAPIGVLSALLPVSSLAVLCLACATRGYGPGAPAPEPSATVVSTSANAPGGAVDASRGDAPSLDAPDASSADAASGAAGASEEITPELLREALAWRVPASFRVRRVVRQAGGLDDEVSSGILTLDAQGTVVWSLDDSAFHLFPLDDRAAAHFALS